MVLSVKLQFASWTTGIQFSVGTAISLRHRFQTGSENHPASYPMGGRDSLPGGKVARAWSLPLTNIQCL